MAELIYFERIEAFAEGEMSVEESDKFQLDLSSNSELKKEYEAYMATQKVSQLLGYKVLGERISHIESRGKREKRKVYFPFFVIAASFLLLIIGFVWYAHSNYSNQALASNYTVEPNLSSIRSSSDKNSLKLATDAYYSENYREAIQILSGITSEEKTFTTAQFILGHTYLKEGAFAKAVTAFETAISNGETVSTDNARWHLVLALLSLGEEEEAGKALQPIRIAPNNNYYTKAIELEKDLSSFWRHLIIG
ncbi:MAG: hypothetical protein GY705_03095 [Bacteroidetes bacterium]|nr:hypothetical protein [Bacteroidota bacterium]